MYIYMNRCKQITDVKFLLLHKILERIFLCEKKWAQACLKILSRRCVYKSFIFNIYISTVFGIK